MKPVRHKTGASRNYRREAVEKAGKSEAGGG